MEFKQFYLSCLAHASYYLGSETEAAVIDPQRNVQQYLDEAEINKQKIKYIIETHSHADFVSGHVELAAQTINLALNHLLKELDRLDPAKPTCVICQGGYRSSFGTSILENAGFGEIYNVSGGTKAWTDAGFEIEVSATVHAD